MVKLDILLEMSSKELEKMEDRAYEEWQRVKKVRVCKELIEEEGA